MNKFFGFFQYLYLKYFKSFIDGVFGLLILPFLLIAFPFMWIWEEWDNYKEYLKELDKNE